MAAPIILVPGFWLGAWAWDEVVSHLESNGHRVTALTLPGLESIDSDRSTVSIEDHVTAITDAIEAAGEPVVLVVHSGAGYPGYAATDRVPSMIAGVVYVDTGPGVGAMNAEFEGVDYPLPPYEEIKEEENFDGVPPEKLEEFWARAVPQPGGTVREAVELSNDARLDIPSTVVATGFPSADYKDAVEAGYGFVAGLAELRNYEYVDMPTGHWPMWSRPGDLAEIIGEVAKRTE
jgi:pimeloyl-ACP methyl ester carboxylesterase